MTALTGMDAAVATSAEYGSVVSSWRGTERLHDDIPIISGRVTTAVTQQVPERLTFTVPRWDGRDWLPGADHDHPLARYGQEVSVAVHVGSPIEGATWETQVGRFLITDHDYDDQSGQITVSAVGMLQVAVDDQLATPITSPTTGTFLSEARRIAPPGVVVYAAPGLVDRYMPPTEFADRIQGLYEIAEAWPARLRTDEWGQYVYLPPLPNTPVPEVTLRDGEGGTVVSVNHSDTRAGAYNRIIARSTAPGSEHIQVVVDQTTGPMAVGTYRVVSKVFASPLIDSTAGALAAARSMLRTSLLPARTVPVTVAPDPRLRVDRAVEVIREDDEPLWGWVVGTDLPLTVGDGAMRIDVGVAS